MGVQIGQAFTNATMLEWVPVRYGQAYGNRLASNPPFLQAYQVLMWLILTEQINVLACPDAN